MHADCKGGEDELPERCPGPRPKLCDAAPSTIPSTKDNGKDNEKDNEKDNDRDNDKDKDNDNDKDKDMDNCKSTLKEQPQKLVAFVTLVTFLTIENNNLNIHSDT